jgi:sarcosine oxidase subunit gamma
VAEPIPVPRVTVTRADRALVQLSASRQGLARTRAAFRATFGFDLPDGPRRSGTGDPVALGIGPARWMVASAGPDAALLDRVADAIGADALATDQSDARAVFRIAGPGRSDLLERVVAIDVHARAFADDAVAVTEMAGMSAILWTDGLDAVLVAVPTSVEEDAARLLDAVALAIGQAG